MKIKTNILQEMISKAIKGASNNKMIPITSFIGIELKDTILTLMTTDGSNQLRIKQEVDISTDGFYTIVDVDMFSKLVGKTTSEFIFLENKDNFLEVKGNGTYKLEIPINEEGEMIKFPVIPDVQNNSDFKEWDKISIEKLKNTLSALKVSVAKTMEVPCLTGYYLSEKNVSTDRQMMCYINDKSVEEELLISSEMGELLQLLDGDIVKLIKNENELLFETTNIQIYGKELEGKDIYPVKDIEKVINLGYNNTIKVNKQDLLNVLDRMSLFVSDYDKNGVYLKFGSQLGIVSQKSNAEEIVTIQNSLDAEDRYICLIDIEMLKSQVQNIIGDLVEIHYGQDKMIKLVEGNTSYVICLLEKANI